LTELKERINAANGEAARRMLESVPVWIDIRTAGEAVPGMRRHLILHAGPPISWDRMCAPQRSAVCGAVVHEGLAGTLDEAADMVAAGEVDLAPCHQHQAVGSMCGVISFSMPVLVVRNKTFQNEAYCHIYEHPGREKLSYGTYNEQVAANLTWLQEVLAPTLGTVIRSMGELDIRSIIARALSMGDDCHSRNFASTSALVVEIAPELARIGGPDGVGVLRFLKQCSQFALHLVMAACKATADAAAGIPCSTVVTTLARNGVETGIRVSGLDDRWFTGPAGEITGLYFSGFGPQDGVADIGDSAITETIGLGAFAHAASPALALVKSDTCREALGFTDRMRAITVAENPNFPIPYLDSRGTPTGIDIRLVVDRRTVPIINTAAADRQGRGQIGVGNATAPMQAFVAALRAFADEYDATRRSA